MALFRLAPILILAFLACLVLVRAQRESESGEEVRDDGPLRRQYGHRQRQERYRNETPQIAEEQRRNTLRRLNYRRKQREHTGVKALTPETPVGQQEQGEEREVSQPQERPRGGNRLRVRQRQNAQISEEQTQNQNQQVKRPRGRPVVQEEQEQDVE